MTEGRPGPTTIDDLRAYLNCAAIALLVLSAIALIGAYGPYPWISPEAIQGVSGKSGSMFVVPLTGALVISGLQLTSNLPGESMPTTMDMALFSLLHMVAFLASLLAVKLFQITVDSLVLVLISTALTLLCPALFFVFIRRKSYSG